MTTTHTAERHCGNCGASVAADAVTCPACDALLAAYEAPSGSDVTTLPSSPIGFEPVPATPTPPPSGQPASKTTPRPSLEPATTSFSTDAALEEARRALGMAPASESVTSKPELSPETAVPKTPEPPSRESTTPAPPAQTANDTAAPAPQQLQRKGRKLGPPPAHPVSRPTPEPTKEAGTPLRTSPPAPIAGSANTSMPPSGSQPSAIPAPPPSGKAHPAAMIMQLVMLGIFAFFFLSIVRSFPFGVSPFIMIIFAFVILSHLMRIFSRAGGRKTTTMRDPGSRSGWKR